MITVATDGVAPNYNAKTHTNTVEYPHISTEFLASIQSNPIGRLEKISQLVTILERDALLKNGGVACSACHTLFVPNVEKNWTESGYCSKSCMAAVDGHVKFGNEAKSGSQSQSENTVTVKCANGHQYDVQKTFIGVKRPCTVCGKKNEVL